MTQVSSNSNNYGKRVDRKDLTALLEEFVAPAFTVEALAPWSYSKYKCLVKCPLQFYLKYLVKYKVEDRVTPETQVGKACHEILELVMKGVELPKSFLLVRERYRSTIPDELWAEKVETLEMAIQGFKDRMQAFATANKVVRVFLETRLAFKRDYTPCDFWDKDAFFRGVIDFAVLLDNGDLIAIDHKAYYPAISGIRHLKDQLDTYKILFNYGFKKLTGAQGGIFFVGDNELKLDEYASNEEIEGRLRGILEFSLQGAIDKTVELGYFKHVASSACQWCDYKAPCKNKEFKGIEIKTKELFVVREEEVIINENV